MSRRKITFVLLLGTALLAAPALAAPIDSRSDRSAAAGDDAASVVARDLAGNDELVRALAAHGLSPGEVEHRLAQLSDEDLRYLRANLDQVQAAGGVPDYIWILLAVFLGVLIVGAVF